jgi:hypothetical protein
MLQLFSSIYGQDRQLLSDAYDAACDELEDRYRLNRRDLGTLVSPLVDALVSLYTAGQHDQQLLNTLSRAVGPMPFYWRYPERPALGRLFSRTD